MKRTPLKRSSGQPLQRKTGLRNTSGSAASAIKREKQLVRAAMKPSRPKVLPKSLRDAVWAREEGLCALCGLPLPEKGWACHHRVLVGQGGHDELVNLLGLHNRPCHLDRIHANPTWAKAHGYIVHPNTDPATRPVHLHASSWALPGQGEWIGCEPPSDYTEEAA